jgi:putative membrane protein
MLEPVIQSFISGFPILFTHFLTTIAVFLTALTLYMVVTPHKELKLIKNGNLSASVSLGGVMLGLAIPLAFCLAGSVNVADIVIWGLVILLLQLGVYFLLDLFFKGLSTSIQEDKLAPAITLSAMKVSIAILNASAIAI